MKRGWIVGSPRSPRIAHIPGEHAELTPPNNVRSPRIAHILGEHAELAELQPLRKDRGPPPSSDAGALKAHPAQEGPGPAAFLKRRSS